MDQQLKYEYQSFLDIESITFRNIGISVDPNVLREKDLDFIIDAASSISKNGSSLKFDNIDNLNNSRKILLEKEVDFDDLFHHNQLKENEEIIGTKSFYVHFYNNDDLKRFISSRETNHVEVTKDTLTCFFSSENNSLKNYNQLKAHRKEYRIQSLEPRFVSLYPIPLYKSEGITPLDPQINSKHYNAIKLPYNTFGSNEITIAVLDLGVDTSHPGLQFSSTTKQVQGDAYNEGKNPYKFDNHGTLVAGLIKGSIKNNNKTFRGIAPKCNLISYRVAKSCRAPLSIEILPDYALKGIKWAVDNGAKIINCSWKINYKHSDLLYKYIKHHATTNHTLFVFAGGNNGNEVDFPARMNYVIAVGGATHDKKFATKDNCCYNKKWFSSPGKEIDITAPSNCLWSFGNTIAQPNDYFDMFWATSCATPIVSGAIALYLSEIENSKDTDYTKILEKLKKSADPLIKKPTNVKAGFLNIKELLTF